MDKSPNAIPPVLDLAPETVTVTAFRIPQPEGGIPILVVMEDSAPGQGRVIVESFGEAWAAGWVALGTRTVADHLAACSDQFLAEALWPQSRPYVQRDFDHLKHLIATIKAALPLLASASVSPTDH